ncbi:MAG: hypothetical protein U1E88_00175 [Acinetobacter sp.]
MKILDIATPMFERTLINAAHHNKHVVANAMQQNFLGCGSNTLTRKLKT